MVHPAAGQTGTNTWGDGVDAALAAVAPATLSSMFGSRITTSDYGLHVSPTGSDADDGLSPATAKLTLATAIASIPAGSLVRLARGRHTITSLLPSKAIRIVGAGTVMGLQPLFGDAQITTATADQIGGTVLAYAGTTGDALKIAGGVTSGDLARRNSSISDLTIVGPGSGTSRGLVLGAAADGGSLVRMNLQRVNVVNFATGVSSTCENSVFSGLYISACLTGLYTEGAFNGNAIIGLNVEGCTNYGVKLTDSDGNVFTGGVIQGNVGIPLSIESADANAFMGLYFEQAAAAHSVDIGVAGTHASYNSLVGCHFEPTAPAIRVGTTGYHTRLVGNEGTPPITLSGNYSFLQGTFIGAITDTGASNIIMDAFSGRMQFGITNDMRVGTGKKFIFEDVGTGSYIMRSAAAETEIGAQGLPLSIPAIQSGTTAPSAGGAGALPATPAGYVAMRINGTLRQIPYY